MARLVQGAATFCLALALLSMLEVGSSYTLSKEDLRFLVDYLRPHARGIPEIKVVYCGGCGYGRRFRRLQDELQGEFPSGINIVGESSAGITGYFEVSVGGKLVHSKKNGDGFVDSKNKFEKIVDAVNAAMA